MIRTAGIVDCGCGNVGSLFKAIDPFFSQVIVSNSPQQLQGCDVVFMPGSGSAGVFRERMRSLGFDQFIMDRFTARKPVIGICLGFQLIFSGTEEDGGVEGLGLIDGRIVKLDLPDASFSRTGWYPVDNCTFWGEGAQNTYFYFNHSYGLVDAVPLGHLPHGGSDGSVAWIRAGRLAGFQFHPEKSQAAGRKLLKTISELSWLA